MGSEHVAQQCRENIYAIQTLRDFQYIVRDGQDQGANVREKAKQLVSLLRDEEIRQERSQAQKTRERMAYGSLPPPYPGHRTSQSTMTSLQREEYIRSRGSPSLYNSPLPPLIWPLNWSKLILRPAGGGAAAAASSGHEPSREREAEANTLASYYRICL
ncbi:hypothetical protein AOLI_G00319920 [Acnodon oligacanthus]